MDMVYVWVAIGWMAFVAVIVVVIVTVAAVSLSSRRRAAVSLAERRWPRSGATDAEHALDAPRSDAARSIDPEK